MCGIAGIWHRDGRNVDASMLEAMTDIQTHRGPDDRGIYLDASLGLGHRRLSVIDLSDAGHQPMANAARTIWITYNGEIYNYIELRDELRSHGMQFTSSSDTEVLLKAYEQWGPDCLHRLNGIFSFAIWDRPRDRLFCARDRFGVKPFHYSVCGDSFLFASEIKGILASGIVATEPDWTAIDRYLSLNLTHIDERTFFHNVRELPAAHYLIVERDRLDFRKYWQLPPYEASNTRPDEVWLRDYFDLLNDSVRLQMRSDVPVGVCLSGGLDSTSLTKLAADRTPNALHAFTAYLPHPQYDERDAVRAFTNTMNGRVVSHLVAPDMDNWFDEHMRVVYHHDEPHAGLIAAAQWEVMRLAKHTGITVLLDGQGADESLGGYNFFVESLAADYLRTGSIFEAIRLLNAFEDRRGSGCSVALHRMARSAMRAILSRQNLYRLEAKMARHSLPFSRDWLATVDNTSVPTLDRGNSRLESEIATALQVTMLPTLLTFEDRISMAFSVESRVPYLDHRLVELAYRLPQHLRIDGNRTKVILRRLMEGTLPDEIVHARLKKVLGTPYQLWFEDQLISRARDLLQSDTFRSRPFVDAQRVDSWIRTWGGIADDRRSAYQVWNMVNLEIWFRTYVDRSSLSPLC